jgi:hypothetical protein
MTALRVISKNNIKLLKPKFVSNFSGSQGRIQ